VSNLDKKKEELLDNILKDNISENNSFHYNTISDSDVEVKVDGKKLDLKDFEDWFVWGAIKEKNSIFDSNKKT